MPGIVEAIDVDPWASYYSLRDQADWANYFASQPHFSHIMFPTDIVAIDTWLQGTDPVDKTLPLLPGVVDSGGIRRSVRFVMGSFLAWSGRCTDDTFVAELPLCWR